MKSRDEMKSRDASSVSAVKLASLAHDSLVDLSEQDSCDGIVQVKLKQLDDLVEILVHQHQVGGAAESRRGPAKFAYVAPGKQLVPRSLKEKNEPVRETCLCVSKGGEVSFDWLLALGCLNCGAPVHLQRDFLPAAEAAMKLLCSQNSDQTTEAPCSRPAFNCRFCGHEICPLHFSSQNEALADCLLAGTNGASPSGAVYVHGTRTSYTFPSAGKQRWQRRFLGVSLEQQLLEQQLALMQHSAEATSTRSTCREVCERCGNGEAFFSTFQARSADEGMTILYECTKCGHRKVFNN